MSIKSIGKYVIKVNMFVVPKTKFVHFTNLEDSDEESSETYKRLNKLISTKEIDIDVNIDIAHISNKNGTFMGIEFQNGKVIYRRVELKEHKGKQFYIDSSHNIAFSCDDSILTLRSMERCYTCKGLFKKIYRCYDCFPHLGNEEEESSKKKYKYDFCKACYKRREHINHRVITIRLDEELLDKYTFLESE